MTFNLKEVEKISDLILIFTEDLAEIQKSIPWILGQPLVGETWLIIEEKLKYYNAIELGISLTDGGQNE